jgi:hypothetical protein
MLIAGYAWRWVRTVWCLDENMEVFLSKFSALSSPKFVVANGTRGPKFNFWQTSQRSCAYLAILLALRRLFDTLVLGIVLIETVSNQFLE